MRHLGDITKLDGACMEPVNVIIGGSPCQDLSIAGRREGLSGERSGLFMEQIRIIKEMWDADRILRGRTGKDIRPRFMVWENVPGALSSNSGRDFAAVLEETIRVVFKEAPDIPVPKKGWPTAGCISVGGDRPISVAYRVLDAQFWGVPQLRRRIALVADFAGGCAPEILFEREGMPGDHQTGRETWKRIAAKVQTGAIGDDNVLEDAYTLKIRGGCAGGGKGVLIQTDRSATLSTLHDQTLFQYGEHGQKCIVRRLTPLEYERLQGFPEGWTNIGDWTDAKGKRRKGDADAPRYKALGNSIALPPWCYVLTRLSLVCGGEQTMGSLFDGIGGFPLIWETINGKNTCLWASEIEDFPIAVTQKRFNGEE